MIHVRLDPPLLSKCTALTSSVFETLAEDFSQPSKEPIMKANFLSPKNNRFEGALDYIWSAMRAKYSVQSELDSLAGEFMARSHARDM